MKILCGISGIEFTCEHFPAALTSRETAHPIFYLTQKKLLNYTTKFASGELTETDSYLLFLALLNSSDSVEFRVPCKRTGRTTGLVYNHMEDLVQVIGKLNLIQHPTFVIPKIAITPDTSTLDNVEYWIANWNNSIEEWKDGYASYNQARDLVLREAALERLIKSPHHDVKLASQLAEWAELAGNFPTYQTTVNGAPISLNSYWKQIIRKCINKDSIFTIPLTDITELIEHCEEHITHGSIYSHSLMEMLRAGRDRNKNYLGIGDWDLSSCASTQFRILSESDSVESANFDAICMSAPSEEPKLLDYPSRFAWLKAKVKWDMVQSHRTPQIQNQVQSEGESK